MTTRTVKLFLEGYGSRLRIEKGCLYVKHKGRKEEERYPLSENWIAEICMNSGVSVSTNTLAELAVHRIYTLFLSGHGKPVGTLENLDADKHVKTRMSQYEALKNGKGLEVAKQCLLAKMNGQSELLRKYGRHPIDCYRFSQAVKQLEGEDNRVGRKKLMSYEGKCASQYWNEFFQLFNPSIRPKKRITHWAYDGLNNVLNLAYKFLSWKVRVALSRAGLDGSIGFLHAIRSNMPSLVYDFMEIYRPLVDDFVIEYAKTVNLSETGFDFATVDHAGRKEIREYLERSRATEFKKMMDRYFERKVSIPRITGEKVREIETLMQEEAMTLARYLRDEKKKWKPLLLSP